MWKLREGEELRQDEEEDAEHWRGMGGSGGGTRGGEEGDLRNSVSQKTLATLMEIQSGILLFL